MSQIGTVASLYPLWQYSHARVDGTVLTGTVEATAGPGNDLVTGFRIDESYVHVFGAAELNFHIGFARRNFTNGDITVVGDVLFEFAFAAGAGFTPIKSFGLGWNIYHAGSRYSDCN